MRICLIYQGGEFPPSERIEKTGKSLAAAGHEVFLLCNNYGQFALHDEMAGAIRVIRIRPTLSSHALNRLLKLPVFLNPLWVFQLVAMVRRFRIDALQVIDVPLLPAAVWTARLFRIPVVLDMWENYPEALRGWGQMDWKKRVFKNHRLARLVEQWGIRRVDQLITVVEEQKIRLIAEGISDDRITVVTNAFDEKIFFAAPTRYDTPLDADPDSYKMLYVGGLGCERGLEDIVRATALARAEVPELRVYIAGRGMEEARLRALALKLGVSDNVRFIGWIPFEDIHSYIGKSDLCLVPHVYNEFINTTIPNKLFQYMAMGKPVLVSHAKPLARIVSEGRCGFVFESGNPVDAAAKMVQAYAARDDTSIGERGRRLVQERYTWDHAAKDLIAVYSRLKVRKPSTGEYADQQASGAQVSRARTGKRGD